MPERTDLNMTRRLRRLIRVSGLPLSGPAHQLRMDFVRANAVDELHSRIETWVWADLPAWPDLPPWR